MDMIILDTSSLISNPTVYKQFPNSTVIIPIVVLSELDKLKKQLNETGKNARVCIKLLDEICERGDIDTGILLENDILLKVDVRYSNLSNDYKKFGPLDYGDTQILVNAYEVQKETNESVTLITNDINLRIKAQAFRIHAQSCVNDNSSIELYTGYTEVVNTELGYQLEQLGTVDCEDLEPLNMNEFVLFKDLNGDGISVGRKLNEDYVALVETNKPWGINSKNKEQAFAIDLLLDNNVKLVTLTGIAGCGKTLLTLSCALQLIVENKKYNKCIIYRPVEPVGKDIGYLPGDLNEKIAPYFQNINDNLEALSLNSRKKSKSEIELLKELGKISYEPLTYIRGRSISNALMIVDEAQNLSPEDIKTVLTRVGSGTKVILNGDINQIDNTALDASNNGLTYVINKFKGSKLYGHVNLVQGERSLLAEEAANRL